MRFLILGGTQFLSRATAEAARDAGHDVTCAARGESGAAPDGTRFVVLDRSACDWSALDGEWDAVIDVARTPSWVRAALEALAARAGHWTFVSSISVYSDAATRGGSPETLPTHPPEYDDREQDSAEAYGAAKVACENLVRERLPGSLVIRPGLIVGPGDPTGRFSYWPERMADPGPVLAPGEPRRTVQVIDVRDLAAFLVHCASQRASGVVDTSGLQVSMLDLLGQVGFGVEAAPDVVWAPEETLLAHDVRPWSGPRSLPLWLPPELSGMLDHDVSTAYDLGLTTRPIAETARDTLAWLRAEPDAARTGLTRPEEAEVLQRL